MPVSAPVPVVPAAKVVLVVPVAQSVPSLKPVGNSAVAVLPIASKFSVKAVPVDVIFIWALPNRKRKIKDINV